MEQDSVIEQFFANFPLFLSLQKCVAFLTWQRHREPGTQLNEPLARGVCYTGSVAAGAWQWHYPISTLTQLSKT